MTAAPLRTGYTTGACAAAAAAAAARRLRAGTGAERIEIPFPDGSRHAFAILDCAPDGDGAAAAVRKDAGDDPDVTDGCTVRVRLAPRSDGVLRFLAGEGIGTVTKPGLSVPVGEPAINPGPRRMIEAALREHAAGGFDVTVSIPGGAALAEKTFNPRLGIRGGLSILGTTGIVRPRSTDAMRATVRAALDVAAAAGVAAPALVPGNIGAKALRARFALPEDAVVEVANEWDAAVDGVAAHGFTAVLCLGHPGKLGKLPAGHWRTHSRTAPSALPFLRTLTSELGIPADETAETVEGLFAALGSDARARLGDAVAGRVADAVRARAGGTTQAAVILVDMAGETLGTAGSLGPWEGSAA
ncbi:MAG: cobalt-precorrin-5B (C(1))-methyltransferase CbiD [Planctomycetota bacterium]